MSELTDSVRKMLSQAQVFVRDTPFEAVARAQQALGVVDAALAEAKPEDRAALSALRRVAEGRLAKYEARLAAWIEESRQRSEAYTQREREIMQLPLRARV